MTTRKPDTARANFMALAAEAPGAVPGHLTREDPVEDFPRRPRYDAPEDPEEAARATFLAAANDAPGAIVGALARCSCRRSIRPGFILWDRECPRHSSYGRLARAAQNKRLRITRADFDKLIEPDGDPREGAGVTLRDIRRLRKS